MLQRPALLCSGDQLEPLRRPAFATFSETRAKVCTPAFKRRCIVSISELGSLGEFVASLAVLVTLVLLLLQFRSARKELSGQVTREIKRHNNDTFHRLTQDPALMDIHTRGQRDYDALTWGLWMFTWISQTEDGYIARRSGIPDMPWVDRYVLGVASALRSPGGAAIWSRLRGFCDEDFAAAIDKKINEESTTWLQMLLD